MATKYLERTRAGLLAALIALLMLLSALPASADGGKNKNNITWERAPVVTVNITWESGAHISAGITWE